MLTKVKVFNVLGNSLILTLFGVFSVTRVRANTSSEQHYIHIIRYAREGKNRRFSQEIVPKTLIAENFFVTLHSKQRNKQTEK